MGDLYPLLDNEDWRRVGLITVYLADTLERHDPCLTYRSRQRMSVASVLWKQQEYLHTHFHSLVGSPTIARYRQAQPFPAYPASGISSPLVMPYHISHRKTR